MKKLARLLPFLAARLSFIACSRIGCRACGRIVGLHEGLRSRGLHHYTHPGDFLYLWAGL